LLNSFLTQNASSTVLILVLFIRSIGLACAFIPLSLAAIGQIKQQEVGNAVGLFNLTRELGGSIGLAVMSTFLTNHTTIFQAYFKSYLNSGNPILHNQLFIMKNYFYGRLDNLDRSTNLFFSNRAAAQAIIKSFESTFSTLSIVFFTSIILVFFFTKTHSDKRKSGMEMLH
jgi:DHA2 family multidrug resistance protein